MQSYHYFRLWQPPFCFRSMSVDVVLCSFELGDLEVYDITSMHAQPMNVFNIHFPAETND